MGGQGSGTWYRWNKRDTVEDYCRLDVRQLHRKGVLECPGISRAWRWWDSRSEHPVASINIRVEMSHIVLSYRHRWREEEWQDVEEHVNLSWTACNYGGSRPWFLCPGSRCFRRVAILCSAGRYFLCRHCYRLPYASTQETKEDRLYRRANKIRQQLGGNTGALDLFPDKPKWMHYRTYHRLRQEAQLAESLGLISAARRFGLAPDELLPW